MYRITKVITTSARMTNVLSSSIVVVDGRPATGATGTITAVWPFGVAVATAVGAAVLTGVAVAGPGVGPNVGTGVAATAAAHDGLVIVSLSNVTVPFRASARPLTVTPLVMVIEASARIVPIIVVPDPSDAELVTCQKTLQGLAPLMRATVLVEAITRSDVAWKIQTELGSFCPSSVTVPAMLCVAPPEL